jgi:DNA-binding transcriptional LysR family regulator
MNVTLRQIQAFLAVTELGSFTRAADRLGISQPALSQLVRDLEAQLGMRVIDRTSRRTEVAANAIEFEQAMRTLMTQFSDVTAAAVNLASLRDGRLCVAAPPTFSAIIMPPAIAEFKAAHPGIHLELIDTSDAIEELVAKGLVDLGLGTFSPEIDAIDRSVLMRDSLMAFVSPSSSVAKMADVSWQDLAAQPKIGLTLESGIRRLVDTIFTSQGIGLDYAFAVRSIATVLAFVEAGLGVAVLPSYALVLGGARKIKAMPLIGPSVERDICLIKRRGRSLTPAAARFSSTVRKWTKLAFRDSTGSLPGEQPDPDFDQAP